MIRPRYTFYKVPGFAKLYEVMDEEKHKMVARCHTHWKAKLVTEALNFLQHDIDNQDACL